MDLSLILDELSNWENSSPQLERASLFNDASLIHFRKIVKFGSKIS
jgi:hypothetical protein